MAVQTTLTTIAGVVMGLIAGIVVQKWKSRWGRYRQWYIICLLPIFALTVLFFYVPQGWSWVAEGEGYVGGRLCVKAEFSFAVTERREK